MQPAKFLLYYGTDTNANKTSHFNPIDINSVLSITRREKLLNITLLILRL